ncbi:MAG: PepSY domain-containing protein [Alphaproteobacteria bacterium]|nr:PepSY domain-containing protein [Alphaproteobacteria bacterium]
MSPRLRSTIITVHLWLGLIIGFVWALEGLTGSLLVFNRDVERWSLHETDSGPLLPLDEIFARAAKAAHARVGEIETFGPSHTLFTAYFDDAAGHAKALIIDGRSGVVRAWRDPDALVPEGGSTWRWLLRLHEALLMGDKGGVLVGTSGLLLLSSLTLGAILGWPRARMWGAAFAASRWRSTRQKLYGWHRAMGLVAIPVLAVMVPCGVYQALAPQLKPALVRYAGYRQPFRAKPVKRLPAHIITAQRALDLARSRFPGAYLMRAVRPTCKAPVYAFRLWQPKELRRWAGTTTVAVDAASGKILATYDPLNGPMANVVTDNIYPIHTGEAGGLALRILYMLVGLSLPGLYVTGLWSWLHRRKINRPGPVKAAPKRALTPEGASR